MSFWIGKVVAQFLLPPLNVLLVSGIGLALLRRRPRLGRGLLLASWALLYAVSTPLIGRLLLQSLETVPSVPSAARSQPTDVDAIVVLGGGRSCGAPEYGGDTVSATTLERVRYAARLYRRTQMPVLLSGGKPLGGDDTEAELMREVLENELGVPVEWAEAESRTTRENAVMSAPLLHNRGVRGIYLVTHAAHMPRAKRAFERVGLHVVPAPVRFATTCQFTVLDVLPNSAGLTMSRAALHEWLGTLWYRLLSM